MTRRERRHYNIRTQRDRFSSPIQPSLMRVFVAGASGVIGLRLVPLLAAAGHEVRGMTRSPGKLELLRDLGAEAVVCDADALRERVSVLVAATSRPR